MQIMGIINRTPDSFALCAPTLAAGVKQAAAMIGAGADILDIGGESTRPGAAAVTPEEEIKRVVPLLKELKKCFPACPLSLDTRNWQTAAAGVAAGAEIINDVGMLRDDRMIRVIADTQVTAVAMHSRGTPENMQQLCDYPDGVVEEVKRELECAKERAIAGGIDEDKLIFDPGLGFAKNREQNWELLRRIGEFRSLGRILVGHSRKSFLPGESAEEKIGGSIGVGLVLTELGRRHPECKADILRMHDVGMMRAALVAAEMMTSGV